MASVVTDVLLFGGIGVAGAGAVLFILDQTGGDESDTASASAAGTGPVRLLNDRSLQQQRSNGGS